MDGSDKITDADADAEAEVDAHAHAHAEEAHPAPPGIHPSCANDEGEVFPPVSQPSGIASFIPAAAIPPKASTSPAARLVAPPPETVVVGTSIRTSGIEEETRAREAALRVDHAAEIA